MLNKCTRCGKTGKTVFDIMMETENNEAEVKLCAQCVNILTTPIKMIETAVTSLQEQCQANYKEVKRQEAEAEKAAKAEEDRLVKEAEKARQTSKVKRVLTFFKR